MKKNHGLVSIEATLIHETHKDSEDEGAFKIYDGKVTVWIPKQNCQKTSTGKPNRYEFEMPEGLAIEKGLI